MSDEVWTRRARLLYKRRGGGVWDRNTNLGPFGEAAWGIPGMGSGLCLELCTQLPGSFEQ